MRSISWVFFCFCLMSASIVALAQSNPVPFINQPLVPMTVAPGGSGFMLTVNGTGFVSGSVVHWNDTALATTFVTGSQLTATVPASDIAKATTASVTVTSPGTGVTSNVVFLDVSSTVSTLTFTNFYDSVPISYGFYPLITGDFNGDGKLDLAGVDSNSNAVSILLGNGDGSFQAPAMFDTGNVPLYLVAGDFNGDGKLDLAISGFVDSSQQSYSISILLGNGDGSFQAPKTFTTQNVDPLATADLNGDGKLDLAMFGNQSPGIYVFLGNGDGTFRSIVGSNIGSSGALAVGDFNRDGKLDLVGCTGIEYQELGFFQGNGDGTFQAPKTMNVIDCQDTIIPEDLNGDGKLDLITVQGSPTNSADWTVYLGNGDGTFQSGLNNEAGRTSGFAAIGDFNADGKLDLVLTQQFLVGISLGNGDGTFQSLLGFPFHDSAIKLLCCGRWRLQRRWKVRRSCHSGRRLHRVHAPGSPDAWVFSRQLDIRASAGRHDQSATEHRTN